jgi:hypothetical protein
VLESAVGEELALALALAVASEMAWVLELAVG